MYTALWLEDNCTDIPSFIKNVGNTLNVEFIFAETISAAKDIVQRQHIDVFLLDIEIAGERMTGIEFAQQLRTSQKFFKAPIIFISSYSHLARHLFSTIRNCQLLTKPYVELDLKNAIGATLGIYEYIRNNTPNISLIIPVKRERAVEIDTRSICYIEFLKDNILRIQFHDHDHITLNCQRSVRKCVLEQIEQNHFSHLVQIYRSLVVNINEIKSVKLDGREGCVYLFGDDIAKPLGVRYRNNLKNFL